MKRTKHPQTNILNHLGFIAKIANSWHVTTGIEFDDLYSEACFAWLDNVHLWDPAKGRIITFMWYVINTHLQCVNGYNKKYKTPLIEFSDAHDSVIDPFVEKPFYFENLSYEALMVAEVVLKSPARFTSLSQDKVLKKIERTMMKNGISKHEINNGIFSLQQQFKI